MALARAILWSDKGRGKADFSEKSKRKEKIKIKVTDNLKDNFAEWSRKEMGQKLYRYRME